MFQRALSTQCISVSATGRSYTHTMCTDKCKETDEKNKEGQKRKWHIWYKNIWNKVSVEKYKGSVSESISTDYRWNDVEDGSLRAWRVRRESSALFGLDLFYIGRWDNLIIISVALDFSPIRICHVSNFYTFNLFIYFYRCHIPVPGKITLSFI